MGQVVSAAPNLNSASDIQERGSLQSAHEARASSSNVNSGGPSEPFSDLAKTSGTSPPSHSYCCAECGLHFPPELFPGKGSGRKEARCKTCFNKRKREKRSARNRKGDKRLLSCRITISEGSANDWCSALVQIFMPFGLRDFGQENEQVMTLVRGQNNKITELLEKKGA